MSAPLVQLERLILEALLLKAAAKHDRTFGTAYSPLPLAEAKALAEAAYQALVTYWQTHREPRP